jgi:hypothetical protein
LKRSLFSLVLYLFFNSLFAQSPNVHREEKSLNIREIHGQIIDSTGLSVISATVKLQSPLDTLVISSNIDGEFSFKNVKSPNFTLLISSIGFQAIQKNYRLNATNPSIKISPITLPFHSNMLEQVVVNGTPAIVYKADTTEYHASQYDVKENATVEDLMKKMDGIEVDKDGEVTVKGEAVQRARINGKDYFGGDVATAIRDLPADIVEKIQIVDDYGDQAARTGVREGDPTRVLNIVTKSNKRVGTRGRVEAGAGSNERYQLTLNGTRFNGNQQIGFQSNLNNTVTGIPNSGGQDGGSGGGRQGGGGQGAGGGQGGGGGQDGSGGFRRTGRIGLSFNDNITKKLSLNTSYSFNGNNTVSETNSVSEEYLKDGTIYSTRDRNSRNESYSHNFNAKLEYNIDSANWLIITPTLRLNSSSSETNNKTIQTGLLMQDQSTVSSNSSNSPSYGLTLNYGRRFNKAGTTASLQLSINNTETNQERDNINNILYYDPLTSELEKDSLLHRLIDNKNKSRNLRSSFTFSHPLNTKSRLEFNAQMSNRDYDNSQITNVLNASNIATRVDSLSRIFNYSFTESRYALNYRFREEKYNYSLGLTAVPALLKGESESLQNTTRRSSFNLIPIFRFEYQWSRQKRFTINYTGNPAEPSYDQIQDVPDVSNPQNPVVGNPNLKASFRHTIRADFNNYIVDKKINISGNISSTFVENQVTRNTIRVQDVFNSFKRETRFVNTDGNYSHSGNYNFSKTFTDKKYRLNLNGNISYTKSLSLNENVEYATKTWRFNERLGIQITPKEWLEVYPNISYDYRNSAYDMTSINNSIIKTLSLTLNGRFYFIKTLYTSYDISKVYVSGISANISNNPFILNASLTKEFFKRKNGSISLRSYDLLNQNNFINRVENDNIRTDTRTNLLSRFFMVNLSWTPQKWSGGGNNRQGGPGGPGGGNRPMPQRRGDGSYF